MEYIIDNNSLQFVWDALRDTPSSSNLINAERLSRQIVDKGWAFKSDVEDLMYHLDSRLGSYQFDVVKFSKMLRVHWERVCFRPKARSRYVSEFDAIRAEDAAFFLIVLERIGFQVAPTVLIDLLLPSVKANAKKVLNNAELEIFWFNKTRHKYGAIILKVENESRTNKKIDTFKTIEKYTILVKGGEDNRPGLIKISSPKFREQSDPVAVTCSQCGLQWYRGDPDSSSNHRKEHKRRMVYLEPKPLKEMINERKVNDEPELVTSKSPIWKHKEIYIRALAFKREFHYDFVQWQSDKGDSDPNVHGFLFTNTLGAIVGACSFRSCEKEAIPYSWKLDWIWICPKERRKGYLAIRWKALRQRFGNFGLTFPVSDDMKAFLVKHGDSALLDI